MLAEIYEAGDVCERDFKKAEFYFSRAHELGIPEAGVRAEKIIETRNRFFKDAEENRKSAPEKAFKAYAIAAAMGHKGAPLKLADAYLRGEGVKRDGRSAYFWYSEAVRLGDDVALYPLGLCYASGTGVNRDFALAKSTLMKAARLGSEGAKRAVTALYEGKKKKLERRFYSRGMRQLFSKKIEAASLSFECAGELGSLEAYYILACLYEFGVGIEGDREKAREYYKIAYDGGFADKDSKYKKLVLKFIR